MLEIGLFHLDYGLGNFVIHGTVTNIYRLWSAILDNGLFYLDYGLGSLVTHGTVTDT